MAEPERPGDEGNAERECTSPTFHIDILDFVFEKQQSFQGVWWNASKCGACANVETLPATLSNPKSVNSRAASATLPHFKEQATTEDGLLLTNGTGN